ncbi:putative methyl-CpG DNA binding protein [Medicago truncatula]|uniref:Putative methyl-CpG DNA binding protein n=1 Tax=Medicago truncatula TaxID=3880 RepID=A0A072U042_MEDTR|nr:hypothetical protein MTR_7g057870 [Medicago truncatula]RHN45967.1 putative methyl-CpG DNA binding protein [Medicago truncatula]
MDPENELMSVVYGHNILIANNTINKKMDPSTSSVVLGEINLLCLNMKEIIPMNKKVDSEEGAENSIVQQVPPLNHYEFDIMKPTISGFKKQMDIYINKLKELEEPKQCWAMIVFYDSENKVEKRKGRKATSKVIGPISVSYELPRCYLDIDVQRVIATRPRSKDAPLRSTVFDRIKNWTIELRKPADKQRYDIYYVHLPSNIIFRSKNEVVNFLLYGEHPPKPETSKKIKQCNELDSSSIVPNKRMKNCPKMPQGVKMENQMRELSLEDIWKNDTTENNMSNTWLELCEIQDYFDGPQKDSCFSL